MKETAPDLIKRLLDESIVVLERNEWEAVADQFEETERHSTFIAGDLVIVRVDSMFAAVEQPDSKKRVLRLLRTNDEVRNFVEQRKEEYERMWDGCGCKVDYYS